MKPQDILFLLCLTVMVGFFRNKPQLFTLFGLVSLLVSIPLFSLWIFFTAERLVWYAAAFFLFAIVFLTK